MWSWPHLQPNVYDWCIYFPATLVLGTVLKFPKSSALLMNLDSSNPLSPYH